MKNDIPKIQEPFRVPEGYFDTLTARIMERVGSETPRVPAPRRRVLPLWRRAAAAAAVIAVLSTGAYLLGGSIATGTADGGQATADATASYTVDDVADYAMLDHQDVYEIISE